MTESQPSTPRVDIVVPVHGGWAYVSECIRALVSQTIPVRVVVVDDLSPDDTLASLKAEFAAHPAVHILENARNVGFAASCNRGIVHGTAELVVLLNSDVVAEPDMAEQILRVFDEEGPRVGSVSPILEDGRGAIDSFGITADPTVAGFVRFHGAAPDRLDGDKPELLGPYGAAAAYRRTALEDVGLLDEHIFMYGEELDLALRLRAGGWDAAELGRVVGRHIGGASAGRESATQRYLSGFGRGYLLRVYGILRGRHALRAILVETAVCGVRLLRLRDAASLAGRRDGWRAGRGVPRRPVPHPGVDAAIGFRRSLAMRSPSYWASSSDR